MKSALRSSSIRVATGAGLLTLGAIIGLFVLPDAKQKQQRELTAKRDAEAARDAQAKNLLKYQTDWDRYESSRTEVEKLERQLSSPGGEEGATKPRTTGELQWQLSATLYELARKYGVRLISVKYGLPNKEGAKGTNLEALDVEFAALGVYSSLKPFMLALEGSELPFAVVTAKMDESPEGGRLGVVLRAFRQGSGQAPVADGEES